MSLNNPVTKREPRIELSPVDATDEAFLLDVYASTRAEEMALVPWTEEQRRAFVKMQFKAQQADYSKAYPEATHDIILENDRPVGRLYVDRLDTEIKIIDLTILPRERNGGIGSYLIRGLLAEAAGTGKIVTVYVESFNPSLRLFKRLRFSETDQIGIHLLMQWSSHRG